MKQNARENKERRSEKSSDDFMIGWNLIFSAWSLSQRTSEYTENRNAHKDH